jgi:hypothetical protein
MKCRNCGSYTIGHPVCSKCIRNSGKRTDYFKRYHAAHKDHRKPLNQASAKRYNMKPEGAFNHYRYGALHRDIPFELTFEQFMTFWQKPCFYCAAPILTIGIDRVDSAEGYTMGNLVSCCSMCNRMKNHFSRSAFIEQCTKVARNATL